MQNIDKFEEKITKLRKKMEKLSVQVTTDIWKELKGWKPTKDARAVCFSPQQEEFIVF